MLRSETLYDSFLRLRRHGSTFLLSEWNSRKDEGMKYKIVIDSFSFLIKCLIFSLHSTKKQRRLTNSPTYILVYTNIFFSFIRVLSCIGKMFWQAEWNNIISPLAEKKKVPTTLSAQISRGRIAWLKYLGIVYLASSWNCTKTWQFWCTFKSKDKLISCN